MIKSQIMKKNLSDYSALGIIYRDALIDLTMDINTIRSHSVCYLAHAKFSKTINANSNISAVITTTELSNLIDNSKGVLISDDPQVAYYEMHKQLALSFKGLLEKGQIANSAHIAASAVIKERVILGERVIIEDHAVIYEDSVIEDDTYIGPGVIIGARGMQNVRIGDINSFLPYMGGVHIGQKCEVLANAIIQKPYHAYFTKIGRDSKISVKSSIGHGSIIGENVTIAGGSTIAGNAKIGNKVWIGPGCTIRDDIFIGDKAKVMIGSVVAKNVSESEVVSGFFALEHPKMLRIQAKFKKK